MFNMLRKYSDGTKNPAPHQEYGKHIDIVPHGRISSEHYWVEPKNYNNNEGFFPRRRIGPGKDLAPLTKSKSTTEGFSPKGENTSVSHLMKEEFMHPEF